MTRRSPFVVGVNLTWLVPGVVGGSEEYTLRLLLAVPSLLPDHLRLRIYGRPDLLDAYPDLAGGAEYVTTPPVRSKAARIALEHSWLAHRSRNDDVVHHAGGTVPYVRAKPTVVTVHDPQPLDHPENFDPVKRRWLALALPHSVRVARLVLCPSRYTADRLRQLLAVPEHRVRVVPHGHRVAGGPAGDAPSWSSRVAGASIEPERFGRYLLYPAIAYPHKRHCDAVRLLACLGPGLDDVQVVFTGRPGPESGAIHAEAARLGVADRVHHLGRVPAPDLEDLYRSAAALVFPSAYEGFGNPALEAMSLGCPAVVSDAGALPEVVGDAGLVVPVGDVTALAEATRSVLVDRRLADELRAKGRARARCFDVGIAAARLADVYGELASTRRA